MSLAPSSQRTLGSNLILPLLMQKEAQIKMDPSVRWNDDVGTSTQWICNNR